MAHTIYYTEYTKNMRQIKKKDIADSKILALGG